MSFLLEGLLRPLNLGDSSSPLSSAPRSYASTSPASTASNQASRVISGRRSGNHPYRRRSTRSPPAPGSVSTSTPSASRRSFCRATPWPSSPRGEMRPLAEITRCAGVSDRSSPHSPRRSGEQARPHYSPAMEYRTRSARRAKPAPHVASSLDTPPVSLYGLGMGMSSLFTVQPAHASP